MREHFNKALEELSQDVVAMGTLVVEALQKAIKAFEEKDVDTAKVIIEEDEKINNLYLEIEDKATVLIATEQPVASDLRRIVTIVKIINSLERIGDHAVHLAKSTIRLSEVKYIEPVINMIPEMAEICISMVRDAIAAFIEQDINLAIAVAQRDDKIDALHQKLFNDIIKVMKEHPDHVLQATDMLFIIRFLERLGDHVTHICERIVYSDSGKHVELNV